MASPSQTTTSIKVESSTDRITRPITSKITNQMNSKSIEVKLDGNPIEIINLSDSQRHWFSPKIVNTIRIVNSNVYKVPITNNILDLDKSHVIKIYSKFADFFQILNVCDGFVTILPIISGFTIKNGDIIGELI